MASSFLARSRLPEKFFQIGADFFQCYVLGWQITPLVHHRSSSQCHDKSHSACRLSVPLTNRASVADFVAVGPTYPAMRAARESMTR